MKKIREIDSYLLLVSASYIVAITIFLDFLIYGSINTLIFLSFSLSFFHMWFKFRTKNYHSKSLTIQ